MHRQEEQSRNTAVRRETRRDSARRQEEQERNIAVHQVSRADPEYCTAEQQTATARWQQVSASTHPTCSFRALSYEPHNFLNMTDVGGLSVECTHCGALKFEGKTESLCCMKGNVQLESFPQTQPLLQHLYEGVDSYGKHFSGKYTKVQFCIPDDQLWMQ